MSVLDPWERTVEEIVSDWPERTAGQQQHPRETARKMRDRYGEPDEATARRLVWHDNGPWKRTVVYRDGPEHDFPVPHVDHLEQTIDYQVPPDLYDDLARFDGSVYPDRTRGELTAACHTEAANFLALNLAHDLVTGEKTVEEAREADGTLNAKHVAGGSPPDTQGLQFPLPEGDTGDPDVTIATQTVRRNARSLGLAGLAVGAILLYALRRKQASGSGGSDDEEGSGRSDSWGSGGHQSGDGTGGEESRDGAGSRGDDETGGRGDRGSSADGDERSSAEAEQSAAPGE